MGFKMKSGNSPKFKHIGSSPAKEITKEGQARLDESARRRANHKKYLEKDDNRSKFKKDDKGVLRNADGKTVAEMNPQSPAKQAKSKGFGPTGPNSAFGGVDNPELTGTKKKKQRKVFKDDGGKDWKNRHAVKSDAKKTADALKKWWAQASPEERAKAQAKANAKRKAFENSPEYKKRRKEINAKKK